MSSHRTDDEATIARYIAGRLSDEEEAAFEERLLDDAELLARVETDLAMRNGMRRLGNESVLDLSSARAGRAERSVSAEQAVVALAGDSTRHANASATPVWRLAAAFALGLLGPSLWSLHLLRERQTLEHALHSAAAPRANVVSLVLSTSRGAQPAHAQTLVRSAHTGTLVLEFAAPDPARRYRIDLQAQDSGTSIVAAGGARADADGFVAFAFAADTIKDGSYTVAIAVEGDAAALVRYELEIQTRP